MKTKRLLAMILCAVMLIASVPTVWAAEDSVRVSFLYANGTGMQTLLPLTVTDGIAEAYGYIVPAEDHTGAPIETVTVLDVMVAAHAELFGERFTKQTAREYFIADNSFMTKAFGVESSNLSFTINDAMPHDDKYLQSAWGGYYTGYAVDTARVKDGDRVTLFMYKDAYWMDMQPLFTDYPVSAGKGQPFTVCVRGYSIMPYGCDKQENIDKNMKPLSGVTLECTQDFKTFTTLGTLDEDGKLTVSLPQEGVYYLVVRGTYDDADQGEIPLIANYRAVEIVPEITASEPVFNLNNIPVFLYPSVRRVESDLQVSVVFLLLRTAAGSRELVKVRIPWFTIPMQWFFGLFER